MMRKGKNKVYRGNDILKFIFSKKENSNKFNIIIEEFTIKF